MSGLRPRERDAALPARAGEPRLAAPGVEEIARGFREALAPEGAPFVTRVEWTYARWKPGVSITCAYALALEDGTSVVVAAKRYVDGKDRLLAARAAAGDGPGGPRRRAWFEDAQLVLWTPAGDRELAGLDERKLARAAEGAGLVPVRAIRRRRLERALLRYKPERRAVLRLDLCLRDAEPDRLRILARVHPRERAGEIAESRRALRELGGEEFVPAFLGADTEAGILFEAWLEVDAAAPGTFGHAREAGRLLASLHRLPVDPEALRTESEVDDLAPLFAIDPALERAVAGLPALPTGGPYAWRHGDFHPDQIARERRTGRPRLLDLDRVGVGDPLRDLASWIADHLDEDPGTSFEAAAFPLLECYEESGGLEVDPRRLELLVADELVLRGAAAIRRLQAGAVEHARRALEHAREIARRGRVRA